MDISKHLESIVSELVDDIKAKLDEEIQASIVSQIDTALADYDFDSIVGNIADVKLDKKVNDFTFDNTQIQAELGQIGAAAISELKANISAQITQVAKNYIENYNIVPVLEKALESYVNNINFPAKSIKSTAIDFSELSLPGDHISGGIIKNFASTGIDDKSTSCQVTIFDTHVVVEQPILTSGIQVQGNAKIENTLTIGSINAAEFREDSAGFEQLIETAKAAIFKEFAANGVVAPRLIFDNKTIIDRGELAPTITSSNLKKVGTLEELQTRGETLLDSTLYVSQKRVGINTLEPSYALTVWDGEIEVAINKINQQRAFVGTHRPIAVTLGSNSKDNISLDIDGSVTINDLRLGAVPIGTASSIPNWEGRSGEILFNDSPQVGQPIGWVCLGGHRWGTFGLVLE